MKTKTYEVMAGLALLLFILTSNVCAQTSMVTSPDEASLRAAIKIGGWIGFNFNGTVTITNTINITNNVILDGTGVAAIISGGNAVRLFYVANGASLTVTNLTLANGSFLNTNIAYGAHAEAGAIYNDDGIVTLIGCTLTNNSAQAVNYAQGGAIFNNGGYVALYQTIFSRNAVAGVGSYSAYPPYGAASGGSVYTTNGTCNLAGCIFTNNSCASSGDVAMGGAVFQSSGVLTISNCIFTTNSVLANEVATSPYAGFSGPSDGGAVAIAAGSVKIDYGQFMGNSAVNAGGLGALDAASKGGAIYCASILEVDHSSFVGNNVTVGGAFSSVGPSGFGGVLYNSGTIEMSGCVMYSNTVQGGSGNNSHLINPGAGGDGLGGGIYNASQMAVTNCTIALNIAINGSGTAGGTNGSALGGGIFNSSNSVFTAMNVTIASNSCVQGQLAFSGGSINGLTAGAEIANTNGTLRLHNTLVAGTNNNSYGIITDDGYNICSDGSANFSSGSSYNFTDPKLAPLGDYGGPTLCMALLPDSPAIDFGDSAGIPNTDQRGYVRPFGDGPDIGACEYGSAPLVVPVLNISGTTTNILLWFTAAPSNSYRLQASTNLITWTDLNTNGPFASSTNINETIDPQNFSHRFFRLLMQR